MTPPTPQPPPAVPPRGHKAPMRFGCWHVKDAIAPAVHGVACPYVPTQPHRHLLLGGKGTAWYTHLGHARRSHPAPGHPWRMCGPPGRCALLRWHTMGAPKCCVAVEGVGHQPATGDTARGKYFHAYNNLHDLNRGCWAPTAVQRRNHILAPNCVGRSMHALQKRGVLCYVA